VCAERTIAWTATQNGPGEADELPDLAGVAQHVVAAVARLALVRLEQRGEDPHRGRLAHTVAHRVLPEQQKPASVLPGSPVNLCEGRLLGPSTLVRRDGLDWKVAHRIDPQRGRRAVLESGFP
jgi:hypothetical protein